MQHIIQNRDYDDQRTKQKDPFITCQSSSLWMMLKHLMPCVSIEVNDVIDWFETQNCQAIYDRMMKKGIFEKWMNNYRKRELWSMLEIGGNVLLSNFISNCVVRFKFESYTFVSSLISKVEESILQELPVMIGFNSHLDGSDFHHIFVVVGFNDTCFICHDPYGDWTQKYKDKNVPVNGKYPGELVCYHKDKLKNHINKHGLFIRNIF